MDIKTLIQQVRIFLRDTPKLNELKRIEETTDQELFLFANMALSDWNSTPPLIAPIKMDQHPSYDWLILATAMFALQSAGVLNYRNELPYNDSGVNVNPWSKGPAYFNAAGFWSNMVENKKREIKIALNYAQTFGTVLSSEFSSWNFATMYQGSQLNEGMGFSIAAPGAITSDPVTAIATPSKSLPLTFINTDWVPDPINQRYSLFFYHNLMADVDVRVIDPISKEDLKPRLKIVFANKNLVQMFVSMSPDNRVAGEIIAYKI